MGNFYGVFDNSGNVFGASDIIVRVDPRGPMASESKGYADMFLHANYSGLYISNKNDALGFDTGPRDARTTDPFAFKTWAQVNTADRGTPQRLRQTRDLSASTIPFAAKTANDYAYFTWLEREVPEFTTAADASQIAWKVYVARQTLGNLSGQWVAPKLLTHGANELGSLNDNSTYNAYNPRVTTVNGLPWVAWVEQAGGETDVHVDYYSSTGMWHRTGDAWNTTGDWYSCVGTGKPHAYYTSGSNTSDYPNSGQVFYAGNSLDISTVNIKVAGVLTEVPVLVNSTRSTDGSGPCRLTVRVYYNGQWVLVQNAAKQYSSSTTPDALTPRVVGTVNGDVFVTWEQDNKVYLKTANLTDFYTSGDAGWKTLTNPYSADSFQGNGFDPAIAVIPNSANPTVHNIVLAVHGQVGKYPE